MEVQVSIDSNRLIDLINERRERMLLWGHRLTIPARVKVRVHVPSLTDTDSPAVLTSIGVRHFGQEEIGLKGNEWCIPIRVGIHAWIIEVECSGSLGAGTC